MRSNLNVLAFLSTNIDLAIDVDLAGARLYLVDKESVTFLVKHLGNESRADEKRAGLIKFQKWRNCHDGGEPPRR